jgi:hypothetical protein
MSNIVLVVDKGSAKIGDIAIGVEGKLNWTRSQWLATDLKALAAQVAQAAHEHDVEPVIRVGGAATGYLSLRANTGITDAAPIANFPWDVFGPLVRKAYDKAPVPDTNTYGTTGPDAAVEEAALSGDNDALTKVISVAAGEDEDKAEHAKVILAEVPATELQEWNATHKKPEA